MPPGARQKGAGGAIKGAKKGAAALPKIKDGAKKGKGKGHREPLTEEDKARIAEAGKARVAARREKEARKEAKAAKAAARAAKKNAAVDAAMAKAEEERKLKKVAHECQADPSLHAHPRAARHRRRRRRNTEAFSRVSFAWLGCGSR